MASVADCIGIKPNPDIAGIGVRAAMYAQALLTLVHPLVVGADNIVTPSELRSLHTVYLGILLPGCAMLLAAIIQARTFGLTTYHALIVLNLSWVNNFSAMTFFTLLEMEVITQLRTRPPAIWRRAAKVLDKLRVMRPEFRAWYEKEERDRLAARYVATVEGSGILPLIHTEADPDGSESLPQHFFRDCARWLETFRLEVNRALEMSATREEEAMKTWEAQISQATPRITRANRFTVRSGSDDLPEKVPHRGVAPSKPLGSKKLRRKVEKAVTREQKVEAGLAVMNETAQEAQCSMEEAAGPLINTSPSSRLGTLLIIMNWWLRQKVQHFKQFTRTVSSMMTIASAHLILMGGFGLWLWSTIHTRLFDPNNCTPDLQYVVFGRGVSLSSNALRITSLVVYALAALPLLNIIIWLIIPLFIIQSVELISKALPGVKKLPVPIACIAAVFVTLCVQLYLISTTELMIERNNHLLTSKQVENQWTFGQTLALALVIIPMIEVVKFAMNNYRERKEESEGKGRRTEVQHDRKASLAKEVANLMELRESLVTPNESVNIGDPEQGIVR